MDSYRGTVVRHEPADPGPHGAELDRASDDDFPPEPPPVGVGQNERRMQVRAYNCWTGLLGERQIPQLRGLTAADMPGFAEHTVILDFSEGTASPAVIMLGEKLAEECDVAMTIAWLSDVPGRSLLSRFAEHYRQVLTIKAPIGFEAEFVNQRGKTLLYRGILLPFSTDGENIQHVMGVINWKELADPTVTAELRQELEIAAGTAPARLSGSQLGAWADGPLAAEAGDLADASPPPFEHGDGALGEWLAVAREAAAAAQDLENRSRSALHAAIDRAWDFAIAVEADPLAWHAMLAEAGLIAQPRAPMGSVVKLVFGGAYDKPRLGQFVLALMHARRHGLARGQLAGWLSGTPGGLKSMAYEERKLRRQEKSRRDAG